jgi:hypothetical protein
MARVEGSKGKVEGSKPTPRVEGRSARVEGQQRVARVTTSARLGILLALSSVVLSFAAFEALVRLAKPDLSIPQASGHFRFTQSFEFELPRRRRIIDVILLAHDMIFLMEFKTGSVDLKKGVSGFDRSAKWQVEQYALDLRDFHAGSQGRLVIPMLVSSRANASEPPSLDSRPEQFVFDVQAGLVTPEGARRYGVGS